MNVYSLKSISSSTSLPCQDYFTLSIVQPNHTGDWTEPQLVRVMSPIDSNYSLIL